MSHTKEPWFNDENGNIWRRNPKDLYQNGGGVAGDKPLAYCDKGWYGEGEACYPHVENSRRIVACVNACEGITNESLERGWGLDRSCKWDMIEARRERDKAIDQRDDLLAAIKLAEQWLSGWASAENELATIRAAIARVESK